MGVDKRLLGSLALGATVSAAAVTSSAGATSSPPDTDPVATASGTTRDNGFSILGALAQIPKEIADEAPFISVGDLDAATAAAGLTRPETLDADDVVPWLMPLTGGSMTPPNEEPTWAPIPVVPPGDLVANGASSDEVAELVGFSLVDVAWFADAGAPPSGFSVFAGDFDDDTLADGLVAVGDGVVSLGEGEDFSVDFDAISAVSRVGQPRRFATADGLIAMSPSTPLVENWLAGPAETAADDEEFAAIAGALDDIGASSAFFAELGDIEDAIGNVVSPEQREALREQLGLTALDDPFEAVGVGWSASDGESVITFVYVLDDDADPDAAAERVRAMFDEGTSFISGQPIVDLIELDDVTSDGSLVVATTHPGVDGIPWTPFRMMRSRDLPFSTVD